MSNDFAKKPNGYLAFKEFDGRIQFMYKESSKVYGNNCVTNGEVPEKIVLKGEDAITSFVYIKISEAQEKWERHELTKRNIRENHISIETKADDGKRLKGRIVSATTRCINVKLDEPVRGESKIYFNYCSAMAGHFVFTKDDKISDAGYNGAYTALGWAYKNVLHKPQKELVKSLNKKFKKI